MNKSPSVLRETEKKLIDCISESTEYFDFKSFSIHLVFVSFSESNLEAAFNSQRSRSGVKFVKTEMA